MIKANNYTTIAKYTEEEYEQTLKDFKKGSQFLYVSSYGAKLILKVREVRVFHLLSPNNIIENISIVSEPHGNLYDLEYCTSMIREDKLKRILGND